MPDAHEPKIVSTTVVDSYPLLWDDARAICTVLLDLIGRYESDITVSDNLGNPFKRITVTKHEWMDGDTPLSPTFHLEFDNGKKDDALITR